MIKKKFNRVIKYLKTLNLKLKNVNFIDTIQIAKFKCFSKSKFLQKILSAKIIRKRNFHNEICEIVFGFGDSQFPVKRLILVLESSVIRYVLKIISLISYIAFWRCSKRPSVNDLFFLLRRKYCKLIRVRYLLKMKFMIEKIMGSSKGKNFTSKTIF